VGYVSTVFGMMSTF